MIDVYVRKVNEVWLGIAYSGEKIVATALGFDKESTLKSILRSLPKNVDFKVVEKGSDFAEKMVVELKAVHCGERQLREFTLAREHYSEPVAQILVVAASIPLGYVSSYGNIAKAAGADPRLVGQVMASNPLYPIVPCHRVVGSDLSLVGYGGRKSSKALKAKLARLNSERQGFKSEKAISINGVSLKIYPVEYVIEKAKKQGLNLTSKQQPTLSIYY